MFLSVAQYRVAPVPGMVSAMKIGVFVLLASSKAVLRLFKDVIFFEQIREFDFDAVSSIMPWKTMSWTQ